MIKKARVEARVDSQLKNKVAAILKQLDISESEAIRMYFRQIALNKGIPFEIKIPNQQTLDALNEVKSGQIREFDSFDDYFKSVKNSK